MSMTSIRRAKRYRIGLWSLAIIGLLAALDWASKLPSPLFDQRDYSTVILDASGNYLHVTLSDRKQQLCFPPIAASKADEPYQQLVLLAEDRYFYWHPGVNPLALGEAFWQGLSTGRWRGASTITMQLVRMATGARSRNPVRKLRECLQALRLECHYSKEEIFALYLAHLPYGGNLKGHQAAAWRYFRKKPEQLTWSEAATMVILPNRPSRLRTPQGLKALLEKRNLLLARAAAAGWISQEYLSQAKDLPIVIRQYAFPKSQPQLAQWARRLGKDSLTATTLQPDCAEIVRQIAEENSQFLEPKGVANLAILLADAQSGQVLAYQANAPEAKLWGQVDCIKGLRSYGSLLKPFLYAGALQQGLITRRSWLEDIPVNRMGYAPKNFHNRFQGLVPADEALAHSLNAPFVGLLEHYGTNVLLKDMRAIGLTSLTKSASYYGLSLILGGGEANLWQITEAYGKIYQTAAGLPLKNLALQAEKPKPLPAIPYGKLACQQTLAALMQANRPDLPGYWTGFLASRPIAWKTGTSFGLRDAWAIGTDGQYLIGVWVGNANGQSAQTLVGITTAAPILFQVLSRLPSQDFPQSRRLQVITQATGQIPNQLACRYTGMRPHEGCPLPYDTIVSALGSKQLRQANRTPLCCYHDGEGQWHFPPTVRYFLGQPEANPTILDQLGPKAFSGYAGPSSAHWHDENLALVYPALGQSLLVDDQQGFVAKAQGLVGLPVHWFWDGVYAGTSSPSAAGNHQWHLKYQLTAGSHQLAIMAIDDKGIPHQKHITVSLMTR